MTAEALRQLANDVRAQAILIADTIHQWRLEQNGHGEVITTCETAAEELLQIAERIQAHALVPPEHGTPPAFMARRPLQLAVGKGHTSEPVLYVLASDATLWALGPRASSWQQIPF